MYRIKQISAGAKPHKDDDHREQNHKNGYDLTPKATRLSFGLSYWGFFCRWFSPPF